MDKYKHRFLGRFRDNIRPHNISNPIVKPSIKDSSAFENIIKSIPIFTGLFIFLGYLDLATYYFQFNIRIVEYFSISEILLSFLDKTYMLILFFSIVIMYLILDEFKVFFTNNYFFNNSNVEKKLLTGTLICAMIMSLLIEHFNLYKQVPFYKIEFLFIVSNFIPLPIVSYKIIKLYNRLRIGTIFSILTIYVVFFIWFIPFYNNLVKVPRLFDGISDSNIEFHYCDRVINSNKDLIYIGSNQQYLFCYDRLAKQTIVFKKDDMKEFKISIKK